MWLPLTATVSCLTLFPSVHSNLDILFVCDSVLVEEFYEVNVFRTVYCMLTIRITLHKCILQPKVSKTMQFNF